MVLNKDWFSVPNTLADTKIDQQDCDTSRRLNSIQEPHKHSGLGCFESPVIKRGNLTQHIERTERKRQSMKHSGGKAGIYLNKHTSTAIPTSGFCRHFPHLIAREGRMSVCWIRPVGIRAVIGIGRALWCLGHTSGKAQISSWKLVLSHCPETASRKLHFQKKGSQILLGSCNQKSKIAIWTLIFLTKWSQ